MAVELTSRIKGYTMKLLCTSIAALSLSFSLQAQKGIDGELRKIKEKGPIVSTRKIAEKVWPEVIVKAYIPAAPLESAAIFAAFDYQKKYIPNLVESKVVKEVKNEKGLQINVLYEMDMPWPISNSEYINGHYLQSQSNKGSYSVHWFMVESDSADALEGSATFSPFPNEKEASLMVYKAHVDPKSFLAGALRKFMVKDVRSSVDATIKEIKKLKGNHPDLIKKYSDIFRDILSGKRAYLLKL